MRTTVDIPDQLYRELKSKAAKEGTTVKEIVLRSVKSELRRDRKPSRRVTLPLIPSKEPGTLKLDNETIYKIIPFP